MAKLYKFQEDEDCCECSVCHLTDEFTGIILDAESPDEVRDILSYVINEGVSIGIKRALMVDIDHKINILDSMDECCCEDCEED